MPNKYSVEECIHSWPINKLEKLYLKNVCDMKTRRFSSKLASGQSSKSSSHLTSYDIIEMEIIKLIRIIFRRNSASLRTLGLKCVDPNIISSCISDFGNLEIILLNNIDDTDSVLQDLANVCPNLKCLELNKCREFQGDGLQDIIDQCERLETLQLGKQIYPTMTELNEINWSNLKYNLRELSITTKFPTSETASWYDMAGGSSPASTCSSNFSNPNDVYSSTIFNYLNDCNQLEYLALEDFTLRFPTDFKQLSSDSKKFAKKINIERLDEDVLESKSKRVKYESEDDDSARLAVESSTVHSKRFDSLKYLYLRNIRNFKALTTYQSTSLKAFLISQYNLHTLDLIGLYLGSNFIGSILPYLNSLR